MDITEAKDMKGTTDEQWQDFRRATAESNLPMRMSPEQRLVFEGAVASKNWSAAATVLVEARLNPPRPNTLPG